MHFLINHPHLRKDITDTLKLRQHDSEESVRLVRGFEFIFYSYLH